MQSSAKAVLAMLLISIAVVVAASTASADVGLSYSSERIANGDCVLAVSTYDSLGGGNSWITGYVNITCNHRHARVCATVSLRAWLTSGTGEYGYNVTCFTNSYGMGNDSLTTLRWGWPGTFELPGGQTATFQTEATAMIDSYPTAGLSTGVKAITGGF